MMTTANKENGNLSLPGSKLLKGLLGVLAAARDRGAEAGDGGASHQGRGDDRTGGGGGADKSRGAAGGEAKEGGGRHRCGNFGLKERFGEKELCNKKAGEIVAHRCM